MKIKYLKMTHDSNIGDVKEIPDFQANVLLKIGIAEVYTEPKKASPRAKKKIKPKNRM
ncbi:MULTISPECIES: hypothetical protein [Acinetobacter]|uniref:hypothetical protein n=1 Tax=Acinetobacter TaxID=469 RepID=UPI0002CEC2A9|nr:MULTISPECIES: hypothetical protein [Acinetobacter]ENX29136.1 hypothetical protein F890_02238 [Acinetobacter sp. CIP 64.7]